MTPIGYPVSYLHHDRERALWRVDPAFDVATMSWHIVAGTGETELRNCQGDLVTRGLLTADVPVLLEGPDGAVIRLDRIEIDGALSLYLASEPLDPLCLYPDIKPMQSAIREASPEELAELPAFGAGTMIATDEGLVPVDWLRPGDKVQTRDHGFQPVLWVGHHIMPRFGAPELRPRIVPAGSFGAEMPTHDTIFSPGVGILLAGDELRMWFAEREMFARLDRLSDAEPAEGRLTLYTLLFAVPEVVIANGMWVSSVEANNSYVALMPDRLRQALLPRLAAGHDMPARRWMEEWEISMFRRDRTAKRRHIAA